MTRRPTSGAKRSRRSGDGPPPSTAPPCSAGSRRPGRWAPPLNDSGSYYAPRTPDRKDAFVRADVTYLRQDYSVMLGGRRFDLFVRERAGTAADAAEAEARKKELTQRQKALAFAVRELNG